MTNLSAFRLKYQRRGRKYFRSDLWDFAVATLRRFRVDIRGQNRVIRLSDLL